MSKNKLRLAPLDDRPTRRTQPKEQSVYKIRIRRVQTDFSRDTPTRTNTLWSGQLAHHHRHSSPADRRSWCSRASSAYARAMRSLRAGSDSSSGRMYELRGCGCSSSSSVSASTSWYAAPGKPRPWRMSEPSERPWRPKTRSMEWMIAAERARSSGVAWAGASSCEERMPRSHRLTRQKPRREVRRMNQPVG